MKRLFPLLVFLLSTICATAQVKNYYVSPSGSDSNDGSQTHPWKTFQQANSAAVLGPNGTVVHFASGSYTAGVTLTQSGTSTSQRFVWQSDVQYGAKLTGTVVLNSNYSDFRNFDLTSSSDGLIIGFSHTAAGQGNFNQIVGNTIHDIAFNPNPTLAQRGSGCPSVSSIEVRGPSHDNLIDSNIVNNGGYWGGCTSTGGTSHHAVYLGGYRNTVTNNLISNSAGNGVQMEHNPCQEVIANNTIFHNFVGGIAVATDSDGLTPCGSTGDDFNSFNNNISVANGFGQNCSVAPWNATGCVTHGAFAFRFYNTGSTATHNKASNNLLAANFGTDPSCAGTGNTGAGLANSIACNSSSGPAPPPTMSANQGQATTVGIFIDYQDDGSGDYHLVSGSPAIGAGVATSSTVCAISPGISPCVPTTDFAGTAQTSPPSIGANEYQASVASTVSAPKNLTVSVQ